jgi:hypothetical protein
MLRRIGVLAAFSGGIDGGCRPQRRGRVLLAAAAVLAGLQLAAAVPAVAHPVWVADPQVVGVPVSGTTLRAQVAAVSSHAPAPAWGIDDVSFEWERCESRTSTCVTVGSGVSYVLTAADVGSYLRVRVEIFDPNDGATNVRRSDEFGPIMSNPPNPGELPGGEVIPPPVDVASNLCDPQLSDTLVDGYFGSLYARYRTQEVGTQTWVCTRLQPEGGTELAGGRFLINNADRVTQDERYGDCATQGNNLLPGPHPFRSGSLGDTQYLLDGYANQSGEAWVCFRAEGVIGTRMKFSGTDTLFEQDNPVAAVSPLRTPWTPGVASAACEAKEIQGSGDSQQLVNAVIGGPRVWASVWESGAESAELCVRVQGYKTAGGRLTVVAPSPSERPVLAVFSDLTGCTDPVAAFDQERLVIKRSATGSVPASVCVTKDSTTLRFALDSSAGPSAPAPTWTADED